MTTPFRLTASVTLASGQTEIADTKALSVPFREMCEIHEVNWAISAPADDVSQGFDLASIIRTKMSMGRVEVTRNRSNGFIPVWNFSVPGCIQESRTALDASNTYKYIVGHYRWKLPVPLIVPRGQALISQFSRDVNNYLSADVRVTVSYAGRYLPTKTRRPKNIRVPFVSYYEVPSGTAAAISDAQDLVNPFSVPLHVQRFIARARKRYSIGEVAIYYVDALEYDAVDPTAMVTIQNSAGEAVVNNPITTNLPLLFPPARKSWTFGKILNPRERFVVRTANNGNEDVMLSMIGHREEAFG